MKFKIVPTVAEQKEPTLEVGLFVDGDRLLLRARKPNSDVWIYLLEITKGGIKKFTRCSGLGIEIEAGNEYTIRTLEHFARCPRSDE